MIWMDRKKEILSSYKLVDGKPLFSFVEFNILNYCNRNCSFCPTTRSTDKYGMPFELFKMAIDELYNLGFEGLIGFSGFCESTLHNQIIDFVKYARHMLPGVTIVINTNGDTLNHDTIMKYKIVGIDYIIVSAYDVKTYNKVSNYEKDYILINKRFNGDMIKNNRAGALYLDEHNTPLATPCYYPFYMMYIDWNGDLLFCSHNYDKISVMGNLIYDKLIDVWFGEGMNELRAAMEDHRSHQPCNKCNVVGTIMGEEIYEAWKKS